MKLCSENLKFPSVKNRLGEILLLLSFLVRSPKDGDLCKHQEFQFLLLDAAHCGTESEHHVHIFVSFTGILLL